MFYIIFYNSVKYRIIAHKTVRHDKRLAAFLKSLFQLSIEKVARGSQCKEKKSSVGRIYFKIVVVTSKKNKNVEK